jgi:probable phosphoglycerate mutase
MVLAQTSLVYLVRHGETDWSRSGRHTGRTDVPLTPRGEEEAGRLSERLRGERFVKALSSPRQRARRSCELAGFASTMEVDADLQEWDYGDYEGRRTSEIQSERPGWNLFRDGCPNGETLEQVSARADRVLRRLRQSGGNVAVFSHGHFLRILAVRWLALPAIEGRRFLLHAATVSILGYEHHTVEEPAVVLWNDDRHLLPGLTRLRR